MLSVYFTKSRNGIAGTLTSSIFLSNKYFLLVVPIIIFGLGVFLPSKFKYLVLPYLLLALIFGTIIPFIIMKLVENSNSLELLILKDSMEYCSQSFSFTLIIPALLYPLFVHLE